MSMRLALTTCLFLLLPKIAMAQLSRTGNLTQCEDFPLALQDSRIQYPVTVDVVLASDADINALRSTPIVRAGIMEEGVQLVWRVNLPASFRIKFLMRDSGSTQTITDVYTVLSATNASCISPDLDYNNPEFIFSATMIPATETYSSTTTPYRSSVPTTAYVATTPGLINTSLAAGTLPLDNVVTATIMPTPTPEQASGRKTNVALIIGLTLAGLGAVISFVACFLCLRRKRRVVPSHAVIGELNLEADYGRVAEPPMRSLSPSTNSAPEIAVTPSDPSAVEENSLNGQQAAPSVAPRHGPNLVLHDPFADPPVASSKSRERRRRQEPLPQGTRETIVPFVEDFITTYSGSQHEANQPTLSRQEMETIADLVADRLMRQDQSRNRSSEAPPSYE